MATSAPTRQFAPRPERFGTGSFGLALLAHGLLIAALTWGTTWNSSNKVVTASAELWAEIPVQAAPALPPEQVLPAKPIPERPAEKTPDIVTEKLKAKNKPEPPPRDFKAEAIQRRNQEDDRQRELLRQDNLKRMAGLAGATGAATNTGSALLSAAPSSSYRGLLKAKVLPNIAYSDVNAIQGNPTVEIAIRLGPDGTIILPLQIIKSSGNAAFDRAVVRGLEKTETLPRDKDGRFPAPFTLVWSLKE
jgi:colicin import membrane protein